MSIRDSLINDVRVLANETITNSAIFFAIDALGIDNMIFKPGDPMWMVAIKSGTVASTVNLLGANVRSMWPVLNFF